MSSDKPKRRAAQIRGGATPEPCDRQRKLHIQMPRSLHAALEREAERRRMHFGQLVAEKLAIPLKTVCAIG